MGDLAGGGFNSAAMGISRNGQYVVGYGASASTGYEGFRWQDLNGNGVADPGEMIGLGLLPGLSASHAMAVTNAGTVTGYAENPGSGPGTQAFIWQDDNMNGQSDPGEMRVLPDLPGGGVYNSGYAFSGDNRTIVGTANDGTYPFDAARWVRGAGGNWEASSLGQVGVGHAVSHDGSVIVGFMNTSQGQEGFVWTGATGMVPISDFAGGRVWSNLDDVTDDGSVAVGFGETASRQEALIWDRINGIRSVQDFLGGYGLDLAGWTLLAATGISRDGSTIIGFGINPSGYTEAWVAQVPLPGAVLLGAMGLSFAGCLLRRRSAS